MFSKFVRSFTSQSEDRDFDNRTMPSEQTMKSVTRKSISEEFSDETHPIPSVKHGGARVRVYSAGACYTDQQVVASGQRKPRLSGVQDTSLFPGYELSGLVDEICSSVTSSNLKEGDRVVLYCGDDDEDIAQAGYAEFVSVNDVSNLVKIPDGMNLDVAAMLPCGALTAYAAVERAKPFIEERLKNSSGTVNVLIVGAGGLGLWILRLAEYYIGSEKHRVRIAVADTSAEKLELAKRYGSTEVIHWQDSEYEEYIVMRTKNACKGGVDVVIDFVSSQRTIQRALTVLKQNGIILVGGNSKSEVVIDLHQLSIKGQTLIGVHKGTRQQLEDLVEIVASGQIVPPVYQVFPVEQATEVFKQLSQSKINGRAVLRVYSHGGSDSVFFHESNSQGSFPELGSFTNSNNELDHPGTPDSATCSKRPFFRQNSPILEDKPVPLSKVTFSLTS